MIRLERLLIFLALSLIFFQSISAINIAVESLETEKVMVAGIDEPVVSELKITNYGKSENFWFYNLLGFEMEPKEPILIRSDETKTVKLVIYPKKDLDYRGFYSFKYYIRGQDSTEKELEEIIKIIDLKDAFEVGAEEFDLESNTVEVYIKNKENFYFRNLTVRFKSSFFDVQESFSLKPYEKKSFTITLNKEDFKKLIAGFYTFSAEIAAGTEKAVLEGVMKFVEKNIINSEEKEYGLLIKTRVISKTNDGNVFSRVEVVDEKNIISRIFTTFSPEPDLVEREGMKVKYVWNRELKPGENLKVVIRTNWLFPIIAVFLIIAIVVLVYRESKTDLLLKKKVSFVKAKGGEFALKVSVLVNAKKYVEKVKIIEKLPPVVKLYEKFGAETPSKKDKKRLEWSFEKLEAGEVRVISYIIYSKIGILGKFALPPAIGIYERDGAVYETESNRAFFVVSDEKPQKVGSS